MKENAQVKTPAAPRGRIDVALVGLGIAVTYAAFSGFIRAPRRPFDFDEVATVAVAGRGTGTAIWQALVQAADANPPTFYLLEAFATWFVTDPHLAYRLPVLLAFAAVPPALFGIVNRYCGPKAGLAAALLPFIMPLFTFYTLEARPYTPMACAIAWAWFLWQRADTPARAVAFGACLAAATSMHYYAVFALIPFGLGEIIRTVRRPELRLRVWIALLGGLVPIAACWPLLSQFKAEYGGTFWARPQLANAYGELLGVSNRWTIALVGLLLLLLVAAVRRAPDTPARPVAPIIPAEEWTVAVALIGLPVVLYVMASLLNTPMVPRYAIGAVLGVSVALTFVAVQARSSVAVSWVIVATVLIMGIQQIDQWRYGRVSSDVVDDHGDAARLTAIVAGRDIAGLPVAVSNGLRYLPMAFYAARSPGVPFTYLLDPGTARQRIGTDSADRALAALAPHLPLHLQNRREFLATHSRFLVFSENEYWDWLPAALVDEGYALRIVAFDKTGGAAHTLYLAEAQQGPRGDR